MKKQFYIYHRWLGLAACAAIFAWSLTGFLHPVMSWTQPRPTRPFLKLAPLEAQEFKVSLIDALANNNMTVFGGFHTVSFNGATFYQVLPANSAIAFSPNASEGCHSAAVINTITDVVPVYLSVRTGEKLADGDERYAEFLARYFTGEQNAPIKQIRMLTNFDGEYKGVNRLLPVYEVEFDRPDRMKAYVDTLSSKLGTLFDRRKSWLQWAFVNFHNFEFAGMPEQTRKIVVSMVMLLVALTSLSGLLVYGLFWCSYGNGKAGAETARARLRRWHRGSGAVVSVFLLSWSASGTLHLWASADLDADANIGLSNIFQAASLKFSPSELLDNPAPVVSASLVGFDKKILYRALHLDNTVSYYDAASGEKLVDGEKKYAEFLAARFSGLKNPVSVEPVTRFEGEYGFIQKRLPVMKVRYSQNGNERVYVDTASGKLAMRARDDLAQLEDWSFSYLHKGHWLDWAGKYVRDALLMLIALLNSLVAALGIWLFSRPKSKSKN